MIYDDTCDFSSGISRIGVALSVSYVRPLLVRRHSSGRLHKLPKCRALIGPRIFPGHSLLTSDPMSLFVLFQNLPLSQDAFALCQLLGCGPTRPWRAGSILLVITALR